MSLLVDRSAGNFREPAGLHVFQTPSAILAGMAASSEGSPGRCNHKATFFHRPSEPSGLVLPRISSQILQRSCRCAIRGRKPIKPAQFPDAQQKRHSTPTSAPEAMSQSVTALDDRLSATSAFSHPPLVANRMPDSVAPTDPISAMCRASMKSERRLMGVSAASSFRDSSTKPFGSK